MFTINIKSKNFDLSEALKSYATEKVGSLDKYFANIMQADVELGKTSNHHQKGDLFFCEVNLDVPGKLIRAREEKHDVYVAINQVKDILQRELKRYKEKLSQ